MNARFSTWILIGATIATLGCKKLNAPYCDNGDQCNGGMCVNHLCNDGGTEHPTGGAAGGAGGMGGAGGRPSCAATHCPTATPICDVDAGACEACSTNEACMKLNVATPFCAPASDGAVSAPKGTCVGCLTSTNCLDVAKPICDTKTWACADCGSSDDCKALNSSTPFCVTPTDGSAGSKVGMCVGCLSNANCGGLTPICNLSMNVCSACASDTECSAVGPGVCMTDGHCATDAESIYVQNNMPTCTTTASSSGGTKTQPFCTMEPVAAVLAPGRDLVVVNGTSGVITGGSWTYANQVGAEFSIVGKQNPTIGNVSIPAFTMQSGTVYIRSVSFLSVGSIGISASGGTLDLDHVTVSGCGGGGILLNNAAFDIENTTVKNNGPSSDLSWGGIKVQSLPATGPTKLNLVTITGNTPSGMSCATGAAPMGTGVLASGNGSGDISGTCNITTCMPASATCGSQQ